MSTPTQEASNRTFWTSPALVREYSNRVLRPVEVLLLARHREALEGGRVLELGCGAGRVTWYLDQLADETHALDVSDAMLAACERNVPGAVRHRQDLGDLSGFECGSFSAVVASCNVIDVLGDAERRRLLRELARVLRPGGVVVFSSHNAGFEPNLPRPWTLPRGSALSLAKALVLLPRRVRNHLRLRRLERRGPDHLLRVDAAHDFSMLLYYIDRDAQQRQLADCGLELLECLDLDARAVGPGDPAADRVELHYVARRP